jgi:hypothetical protein
MYKTAGVACRPDSAVESAVRYEGLQCLPLITTS